MLYFIERNFESKINESFIDNKSQIIIENEVKEITNKNLNEINGDIKLIGNDVKVSKDIIKNNDLNERKTKIIDKDNVIAEGDNKIVNKVYNYDVDKNKREQKKRRK